MMSRRASRNEYIICSTRKYIINRGRGRTDCRQRGLQTCRADVGIAIEPHHGRRRFLVRSRLGYSGAYRFQMLFRMRKEHSRFVGTRCLHPVEPVEIRPLQFTHQRPDTIRTLWMARRGQMFKIDRMPVKPCRHSFTIASHRHMTMTAMYHLAEMRSDDFGSGDVDAEAFKADIVALTRCQQHNRRDAEILQYLRAE